MALYIVFWRGLIPFQFKVDTNRHQGRGSREKQLETNDLYQAFREMVLHESGVIPQINTDGHR
ncbi:hypothetical protein NIES4073_82760 [Kalymmatonema gypsitolerans NIES-4073]|nr:hypothetical protein NIES4073_82760 [Scytonema sp. NIES-4073]